MFVIRERIYAHPVDLYILIFTITDSEERQNFPK